MKYNKYGRRTYISLKSVKKRLKIFHSRISDRYSDRGASGFPSSLVEELHSNASEVVWNCLNFLLLLRSFSNLTLLALAGGREECRHFAANSRKKVVSAVELL
jgi:hypothetical protein